MFRLIQVSIYTIVFVMFFEYTLFRVYIVIFVFIVLLMHVNTNFKLVIFV